MQLVPSIPTDESGPAPLGRAGTIFMYPVISSALDEIVTVSQERLLTDSATILSRVARPCPALEAVQTETDEVSRQLSGESRTRRCAM